jgi:hypothetical protein
MEFVVPLALIIAAATSAAALAIHLRGRAQHDRTRSLAGTFGLAMEGDTARGEWNGHPMELRIVDHGKEGTGFRFRVGGADPRFRIAREPMRLFGRKPPPPGPFLPRSLSSGYAEPDDIVTGDEAFDERIRVKGPVGLGVGILDRETRRLVQSLDGLGAQVKEGWIELSAVAGPYDPAVDAAVWVRLMAELAEALARRGRARPLDNLLDNFHGERDAEVRRVNLACLGAYFPEAPETLEASRAALTDPGSDWIRLQGAVNLRREGWPALRAMTDRRDLPDGVRAAALRALGLSLPAAEAERLLLSGLDSAVPALALSAAETLGDVGRTAAAAARLDGWAEGRGDRNEQRAGQEAAAKVRARLEGAEPGRLSLEESGGDGRLSRPEGGREGP